MSKETRKLNTIIAKYMGELFEVQDGKPMRYIDHNFGDLWDVEEITEYTSSLDALIPVWNKLAITGAWFNIKRHGLDHYQVAFIKGQNSDGEDPYEDAVSDDIQLSAAISTVKAILKLQEEK